MVFLQFILSCLILISPCCLSAKQYCLKPISPGGALLNPVKTYLILFHPVKNLFNLVSTASSFWSNLYAQSVDSKCSPLQPNNIFDSYFFHMSNPPAWATGQWGVRYLVESIFSNLKVALAKS